MVRKNEKTECIFRAEYYKKKIYYFFVLLIILYP